MAISNHESIKIIDLDLGNYHICTNSSKPVDFAINIRERLIFWLNDMKEIFVTKIGRIGHKKVFNGNKLINITNLEFFYSIYIFN